MTIGKEYGRSPVKGNGQWNFKSIFNSEISSDTDIELIIKIRIQVLHPGKTSDRMGRRLI